MGLFLNLYLGHLLGDYAFQPGKLVAAKRAGLTGLMIHTGVIGICSAVVLWGQLSAFWWVVVLVMAVHFVIEKLTIAARVGTNSRGLFIFVLDQILHILSIVVFVWVAEMWNLDAMTMTFGIELPVTGVAAMCGALTVMLLGSIFTFEAGEAYGAEDPDSLAILRLDTPRLYGMAERGLAFALAILLTPSGVSPWLGLVYMALPFAPRAVFGVTLRDSARVRQLTEAAAGLVLCAATYSAWLAVRVIVT